MTFESACDAPTPANAATIGPHSPERPRETRDAASDAAAAVFVPAEAPAAEAAADAADAANEATAATVAACTLLFVVDAKTDPWPLELGGGPAELAALLPPKLPPPLPLPLAELPVKLVPATCPDFKLLPADSAFEVLARVAATRTENAKSDDEASLASANATIGSIDATECTCRSTNSSPQWDDDALDRGSKEVATDATAPRRGAASRNRPHDNAAATRIPHESIKAPAMARHSQALTPSAVAPNCTSRPSNPKHDRTSNSDDAICEAHAVRNAADAMRSPCPSTADCGVVTRGLAARSGRRTSVDAAPMGVMIAANNPVADCAAAVAPPGTSAARGHMVLPTPGRAPAPLVAAILRGRAIVSDPAAAAAAAPAFTTAASAVANGVVPGPSFTAAAEAVSAAIARPVVTAAAITGARPSAAARSARRAASDSETCESNGSRRSDALTGACQVMMRSPSCPAANKKADASWTVAKERVSDAASAVAGPQSVAPDNDDLSVPKVGAALESPPSANAVRPSPALANRVPGRRPIEPAVRAAMLTAADPLVSPPPRATAPSGPMRARATIRATSSTGAPATVSATRRAPHSAAAAAMAASRARRSNPIAAGGAAPSARDTPPE